VHHVLVGGAVTVRMSSQEDLSKRTVVQLKEQLRAAGLPVEALAIKQSKQGMEQGRAAICKMQVLFIRL